MASDDAHLLSLRANLLRRGETTFEVAHTIRLQAPADATIGGLCNLVLRTNYSWADPDQQLVCIGPGFNTFGLQDYGLGVAVAVRTGNATLYFSPVWRQFELSSPQHNVFVLAQPLYM